MDDAKSKHKTVACVKFPRVAVNSHSPMQFPRASCIKPAPHLTFGKQRKEPWVFWHANSWPQLWIPVSHSSMSGKTHHKNHTALKSPGSILARCMNRGWLSSAQLTFAVVVVSEFVARPTADFSLATERAVCVDAALPSTAVAGSQQALVDIWEKRKNHFHLISSLLISS